MTRTRGPTTVVALLAAGLLAAGCGGGAEAAADGTSDGARRTAPASTEDPGSTATRRGEDAVDASPSDTLETATFAGGCFWCVEEAYEKVDGVVEAVSGYTGGDVEDPGYGEVSSGRTGHYEAVQVRYDPGRVSYDRLLDVFWHNVDPTDAGGQFCDRGPQYRTAIFVHGPEQRAAAERSKERLREGDTIEEEIVTPILDAGEFWTAEEHHQDYYREHRVRYQFYKASCGRERVLEDLWGEEAGG